jgi:dTDP-4-amino-4,6-dideoxygalactose transaminase
MLTNGHAVTTMFEQELCAYSGAKYAVATTSCTMAILLACAWCKRCGAIDCSIPKFTYVGVPASIRNAGLTVSFHDEMWQGEYELRGLPVWDSARRFTSSMYRKGNMQCVSFHWSKTLGLSQGGAILHDWPEADKWLRKARFDGRTPGADPKTDDVVYPSWHAYLSPSVAADGLMKLASLPKHNPDLPNSDYPDLSKLKAFA